MLEENCFVGLNFHEVDLADCWEAGWKQNSGCLIDNYCKGGLVENHFFAVGYRTILVGGHFAVEVDCH